MQQKQFKTEVSDLLHLIIHSLYSHKEIFLRELVSNASDALDKLKYKRLTAGTSAENGVENSAEKNGSDDELKINISYTEGSNEAEKEAPWTLTISDNGIGMTESELEENLGTIAHSGTKAFLKSLTDAQKADSNLIGQFGVGFYSVFMVSDRVEVISRAYGSDKAFKWTSEGRDSYTIEEASKSGVGTDIVIYLNSDNTNFASRWRIEDLVKEYSNHIAYPIYLTYEENKYDDKYNVTGKETKTEQINSAEALWTRPKSELKEEDYNDFYKNSYSDTEKPLFYLHTKAEGTTEYTSLFFIPAKAPFDMYHSDYKSGVKLYVKRVYITDDDKELLPVYLRFVRGIIDSEDLPLNVSREILQQNRIMSSIRSASVKKLLSEFRKIAEQNPELYDKFIAEYNRPLKEGLYQDYANRDDLLELVRFRSTAVDGWTSLAAYKERMKADQKSIYYITGGSYEILKNSPLLSAYKERGIEVLLMTDDIDEFVSGSIGRYKETELKAVNRTDAIDDLMTDDEKKKAKEEGESVAKRFKDALGDRVKDVRVSARLRDVSAVIVADANDPTMQMQQLFRAMGQGGMEVKPILEVNAEDPFVKRICESNDDSFVKDAASVVLDSALLAQGIMPENPAEFASRLHALLG